MQKIVFDCSSELGTNDYGTLLLLSENAPYEAIADVRSYYYHFIYGKYKDCDVNIENNGKYVMASEKCYCKIGSDGKMAEKYPWVK